MPASSTGSEEIVELGVFCHESRDERAHRHHLQSFGPHKFKGSADKLRSNSLSRKRSRHLGMGKGNNSRRSRIIGRSDFVSGFQLKPVMRGIICDSVRHSEIPIPSKLHTRSIMVHLQ